MKTAVIKTPCSEIVKGPNPGVGSEPISGMFSRASLVNTLENWLFKILIICSWVTL